jgi:hypothetical protein
VLRQSRGDANLSTSYRISPAYGKLPQAGERNANFMKRVLIIEDDKDIVELVRYNLANEGFSGQRCF